MSFTVADIIGLALREINVIAETDEPTAEQGKQSLIKLVGMLGMWEEEKKLQIGWFDTEKATDTWPIPNYALTALYTNLAIYCAPQYGKTVTAELYTIADDSLRSLIRVELNNSNDNMDMTHMPEGTGHFGSRYNINADR